MGTIMRGETTPAQMGGFLVALRFKGETTAEIAGCAEAMREHVLAVKPKREDLVDTAGTGGDNAHTPHISTPPPLVAAPARARGAEQRHPAPPSGSGSPGGAQAPRVGLGPPPERDAPALAR